MKQFTFLTMPIGLLFLFISLSPHPHFLQALPSSPYPVKNMELLYVGPDKEYYISTGTANLDTAKSTCSQISKTGQPMSLLAIEDEREYMKILYYLQRVESVNGIWTSGYYSASNKTYIWTGAKKAIAMAYTNFASTAPSALALKKQVRRSPSASGRSCAMDCLLHLARSARSAESEAASTAVAKPGAPKRKRCGTAVCETEPCEPLVILPCNTTTPDCTIEEPPACKTVRPPCSVKCEPCEIHTPPCTVTEIECTVDSAECTTTRPPCQIITRPCETIRPPCRAEQPECTVTTPSPCTVPTTSRRPCEPRLCEEIQPACSVSQIPCADNREKKCEKITCPPPKTVCKNNPTCAPALICQSPAIICPHAQTFCPPPETTCPEPEIICPDPETHCPEPVPDCKNATYICPAPVIRCPAPVVTCPNPVTTCERPEHSCPKPIVDCPDITPVCPPPKKCTFGPPCPTDPIPTSSSTPSPTSTTSATTTTPCSCPTEPSDVVTDPEPVAPVPKSGWVVLNSKYNFKWDIESSPRKAYHFICESNK